MSKSYFTFLHTALLSFRQSPTTGEHKYYDMLIFDRKWNNFSNFKRVCKFQNTKAISWNRHYYQNLKFQSISILIRIDTEYKLFNSFTSEFGLIIFQFFLMIVTSFDMMYIIMLYTFICDSVWIGFRACVSLLDHYYPDRNTLPAAGHHFCADDNPLKNTSFDLLLFSRI